MKTTRHPNAVISMASERGAREYQEDRIVGEWIESSQNACWLLAVFDGHGGAATADLAASSLVSILQSHLQSGEGLGSGLLRKIFQSLNEKTRHNHSGSTASIVIIPRAAQVAYLGVLGDSPVAMIDANGTLHIGPDHNIRTNAAERSVAQARGGVFRGGYLEDPQVPDVGLQMSRALGDVDLSRVLDREPEIQTVELGGRGIVLLGSDGLLSPGGGPAREQLARLLEIVRQGADAAEIVQDALARRTGDNATAIVWRNI